MFNTCSVKETEYYRTVQLVFNNRIKVKCKQHKELTNYRNRRVKLVRKAGPFPLTRFPRERIKLELSKEDFIHLSKEMIHYRWSLALVLTHNVLL